jgi:hypothetical protein
MNMTITSKIDATLRGLPAAPMRALHASTRPTGTDARCMRTLRYWSYPAGRALVRAGLLIGGLATFSSAPAQDSPASDTPPSFFAILKAQGSLAEGVTIGGKTQDRLVLESGGPDYRFIEYPWWHQVRLTFDLTKVVDTETVLATMRAAKAAMQRACGDGALELAAAEQPIGRFALGQATDGFISASYRRLYEEGLVGTFSCRSKGAQAGPPLRIQWESGNRNPTAVIPPNEWRFLIEGVSTEAFARHRLRFGEHRRATDALRAKVGIGAKVQMMADDVPVALLAKTKQPTNARERPYAVCALVTGLNTPLVQVQVQLDTFTVPIQKLFPAGRHATVDELWQYLAQKAPAQLACLI